jgi:hypothetical protein
MTPENSLWNMAVAIAYPPATFPATIEPLPSEGFPNLVDSWDRQMVMGMNIVRDFYVKIQGSETENLRRRRIL